MLTWGAFNVVGATDQDRETLTGEQDGLLRQVHTEIDQLGIEVDGKGWRAKVFLYCVEAPCPQSGWTVPLLPTRMVSKGYRTIVELVPNARCKRYDVVIRSGVTETELGAAGPWAARSGARHA